MRNSYFTLIMSMKGLPQGKYFLENNEFSNRRNFLKLGAFAGAGLLASHFIHNDKKAEAISPALIYAGLLGISALPVAQNIWNHFVKGEVDAENNSSEPRQGYVNIIVLDNSQQFNVQGTYGPYYIAPYSRASLPYNGIVPNGTGQKFIYAQSYLGPSPYNNFYWNY